MQADGGVVAVLRLGLCHVVVDDVGVFTVRHQRQTQAGTFRVDLF